MTETPEFRGSDLYGSVIAEPLLGRIRAEQSGAAASGHLYRVMIDLHLDYPDGREAARTAVKSLIRDVVARPHQDRADADEEGVDEKCSDRLSQYVVARLTANSILEVARLDSADSTSGKARAIYRIWLDFPIKPLINKSLATVKADAAHSAFAAKGWRIVWAVIDSGIDAEHPHFTAHKTLTLTPPVEHQDLTGGDSPLTDKFGHGTHVAGIIAGELSGTAERPLTAVRIERDYNSDDDFNHRPEEIPVMAGMAPSCRLVSYKVLNDRGDGETSAIIAALQHIQQINNHGRDIKIHGVNLSVGYTFNPQWFACGESPVCVEVTRLVKSGVVVVVAAGNTGFGYNQDYVKGNLAAGLDLTINDPGNTEAAITVGSTHRDMPHRYGVSYFSSKGPTGDGRAKPDLVAPGERILSCATGKILTDVQAKPGVAERIDYVEDSGTSMAAAHLSGTIAAFLSIRQEFIGRPEDVKAIFTRTATDLGRTRDFQGQGLVDLMRAIQSV